MTKGLLAVTPYSSAGRLFGQHFFAVDDWSGTHDILGEGTPDHSIFISNNKSYIRLGPHSSEPSCHPCMFRSI